jgi:hypothetical protein
MLNAVLFVVGYLALLCLGGAILAWGVVAVDACRISTMGLSSNGEEVARREFKGISDGTGSYAYMRFTCRIDRRLASAFALAQLGVLD